MAISVSSSAIEAWLQCRLRWQYEYVDKPDVRRYLSRDLTRGTVGHAALEAFYSTAPVSRTLELLRTNVLLALDEIKSAAVDLNDGELRDLDAAAKDALAAVNAFWKIVVTDDGFVNVLTERRVERMFDENEFHSVLDGLILSDDRVIIVENKFPLSMPQAAQYITWSPQHRRYAWALALDKPVYIVYNILTPGRFARQGPFLVPTWQQDEAADVIRRVSEDMSAGVIFPTYGFHCMRCTFRELCINRMMGGEE